MNPDEFELVSEAVEILKNRDPAFDNEDLINLIEHAKETIEQAIYIHEDEGGRYNAKKYRCYD